MKNVLIVEDDPMVAMINEEYLSSFQNIKVLGRTFTEKDTLDFLTTHKVDLIILDVMMPEMNGYQVCLLMREKTNAPILFLTAKGQESDKTLGFSSGGDDYLTKPFSYNELNVRVKALLRRYHVYQGKKEEAKAIIRLNDLEIDQEHKEVYLNKNIAF